MENAAQFAGANSFRVSIVRTPRRVNPIAYRFAMFFEVFLNSAGNNCIFLSLMVH